MAHEMTKAPDHKEERLPLEVGKAGGRQGQDGLYMLVNMFDKQMNKRCCIVLKFQGSLPLHRWANFF